MHLNNKNNNIVLFKNTPATDGKPNRNAGIFQCKKKENAFKHFGFSKSPSLFFSTKVAQKLSKICLFEKRNFEEKKN